MFYCYRNYFNVSGLCKQYLKSLGLMPSGFDFLFRKRPCALWQQTPPELVLTPETEHIRQNQNTSYFILAIELSTIDLTDCFNGLIKKKKKTYSVIYYQTWPEHSACKQSLRTDFCGPTTVSKFLWYETRQSLIDTVETLYNTIPYTKMFDITRWTHGPQNLQRLIRTLIVLLGFRIKQNFM